MAKLFLFDGTGISYRAFFALDSSLSTSTGIPTNATYGVARMMTRFIQDHIEIGEDYTAFVFDASVKTFRHEMFKEYKSSRRPTPDSFKAQIPYIKRLVEAMGVKVLEVPGYEADDVIATLAVNGKERFDEILIITGDKDMLQLVDEKVKVWRIVKGMTELILYDVKKVREHFGVPPEHIVDLLALMGDAVDDVPGVQGIGEKSAVKLIRDFGSLNDIYENLRKIPERYRKLLIRGKERAYESLKLVTLVKDLDLDLDWEELRYTGYNESELLEILKELEFSSIMKELGISERVEKDYRTIRNTNEFEELIRDIEGGVFSLDLETTSLDPISAEIVGISISKSPGKAFYIPLSHRYGLNLKKELVLGKLEETIRRSKIVGQNLKYDMSVLKVHGLETFVPHFDTMIAAWLLNPDEKKFSLDELALKILGYKMIPYGEVAPESPTPLFGSNFSDVSVEKATEYSAEDADITFRLYRELEKSIKDNDLERVMYGIEMPLIPVLVDMELTGVHVDLEYLKELSRKYSQKMEEIARKIFDIAGETFNLNSTIQVANVLEKLGIKTGKKTRTGRISTSADVLEELASEYEIAELILDYRKYQKLKSTYVDALPRLINPKTSRIHASFNQTGTATGRLSSSNPNLQNLPKRDEEGKEIRKAITSQEKGWKILSADYSQIELRILAHMSGDENLIRAFKEGIDIHTMTASRIYNVPEEMVSPDMRRVGKMVNFSIIYGVTPYGLAVRLKIPVRIAQKMISSYFDLYPGVRDFIKRTVAEAERNGFVKTLFGRRREVPQLRSRNKNTKAEGERIAVNTPIQGSAADIIKLAMIRIHDRLRDMKTKMIIQVHDELVFEVHPEELDEVTKMVKDEMENVVELKVPLEVDLSVSDRYE